jgi:hypothetical protein
MQRSGNVEVSGNEPFRLWWIAVARSSLISKLPP